MSHFSVSNSSSPYPYALGQTPPQLVPSPPTQNQLHPRSITQMPSSSTSCSSTTITTTTNHGVPVSSHWNKILPVSCWQPGNQSLLVSKYGWMQPVLVCKTSNEVLDILDRRGTNFALQSAEEILSLAAIIGSLSFNSQDTRKCYSASFFSSGIMNLPASEKATLVKYASISNYPQAARFRNSIANYLYSTSPGVFTSIWPSEEEKLQTLISEIDQLKTNSDHLTSLKLNFNTQPLVNNSDSYNATLSQLKHKCESLLANLKDGVPVHLPEYYLDLGERTITSNSLSSLSEDSGLIFTQEINPLKHGTILGFPSHFEWALQDLKLEYSPKQLKVLPNETVVLEPKPGTPWAFCSIVQRYGIISELWINGSFSFAQINDSLFLTNWQCALMSAILKKNYPTLLPRKNPIVNQTAARPMCVQSTMPNPPPSSLPLAQHLPTLSIPPMQARPQPVLTPAPTPSQTAATTSTVALGRLLSPKTRLNTSIEEVLKYLNLSGNKNRTLSKTTFDQLLEIPELTDEQKKLLNALLENPAYFTVQGPPKFHYKEYTISIPAIIEILGGKPSRIQRKKVKLVNQPAAVSSSSSSSTSTSSTTLTTTTTNSTQAAFAATYPPPQQPINLKRPLPAGAQMPLAQRPKTEFTPDKQFTKEEMRALQEIFKKVEDQRSSQEQILLFIHQLGQGRVLGKNSIEILRLSKGETPEDFYTVQFPYLNSIQKGDVGQKFWASQAYSTFRIERFIELSHVNPDLVRAATMEGFMNTYCHKLNVGESKDAESLVIGKKRKSEGMINEAKTLFNLTEEDVPPAYRQVWHDQDNDDVSLYGKVVGYNPELLFDSKTVQTLLLYTILNLSPSDRKLIEEAYVTCLDDDMLKAAALVAYELIKNSQEGSEEQLLVRDCILCAVPNPKERVWQREHWVIVDFNTFDRAEMHGRNLRLTPNEPHFLWKLFTRLEKSEQLALHEYIIDKKIDNPRIDLVYRYLLDMAEAIRGRYFSRVDNKNGRRSSPMKISNDPIFEALNGTSQDEIRQLETFVEAIHDYPTL